MMEKTLKHWFWLHGVVFALFLTPLFFLDKPERPKPIATIDCDIVHTIPNMPDDILKQCERMKIK